MVPNDVQEKAKDFGLPDYFDMQAAIGHTKHIGGWRSTQEIVAMCQLDKHDKLLYVGSGSGLAAIRIAESYGCHVLGVDLMPAMVARAREWAADKSIEDQVQFEVADAMRLPFGDDKFDVVLCESVNTFVPDVITAVGEYARVAKPGGFVALNEPVWYRQPSDPARRTMQQLTGQNLLTEREWIEPLAAAGLEQIQAKTYSVQMGQEMRSQLSFLSLTTLVRILWRSVVQLVSNRQTQALMLLALREPREAYSAMGFGLYVGKVPS